MRLIFLDIDGVLNSVKSTIALGTCPHPFYPVREGDDKNEFIVGTKGIDPVPAGLINRLAKATGSSIVISSTWRIGHTLPETVNTIAALGIERRLIVGKTDTDSGIRGLQIERFVNGLKSKEGTYSLCHSGLLDSSFIGCSDINLESYVIIDDSQDMTSEQLLHHYVRTSGEEGLTLADTLKAGSILLQNPKFSQRELCKNYEDSII